MFGFGKNNSVLEGPLAIEDARFSADDLLGLLGGYDNFVLTMGTNLMNLDDEAMNLRIQQAREQVGTRFINTGLVNADGSPKAELAAALTPLTAPGFAVMNDAEIGSSRAVGLFMFEQNWTIVRKAPGYRSGWSLVRVDSKRGIDAAMMLVTGCSEPVLSEWNMGGYIKDSERDQIIEAVNGNDVDWLTSFSQKRMLPKGAFLDLAASYGKGLTKMPKQYNLILKDFTGCEMDHSSGFTVPLASQGICRNGALSVVPAKSFYMQLASSPKKDDTPASFDAAEEKNGRTYCRCGFVGEGSFFKKALEIPDVFPADAILA